MSEYIDIKGAREHNLKNINLSLPRNKLILITGLSGSGKSSLAFDTLYAEGHRRYVQSLSSYARQFLEKVEKPDVDSIEGIPPSIAIEQNNPVKHSRSTVGTATEIHDYLRLLFAKIGRTICTGCGREVKRYSPSKVAQILMSQYPDQKMLVLFPINLSEIKDAQQLQEYLGSLLAKGFFRFFVNGETVSLEKPQDFLRPLSSIASMEGMVDRLILKQEWLSRVSSSIEIAFNEGHGSVIIRILEGKVLKFGKTFSCHDCSRDYEEPNPLLFSFNSPYGACPECKGFGNKLEYDADLVIPEKDKTLAEGAIEPWAKSSYRSYFSKEIKKLNKYYGVDLNKPFRDLSEEEKKLIWEGAPHYVGVLPVFKMLEEKKYKVSVRVYLRRYQSASSCGACGESRLRSDALLVKVGGKNIKDISGMTIGEANRFFAELVLSEYEREICNEVLKQINSRLFYLNFVGVDYLTLNRLTRTLSGGEAQRINLANQIGAQLSGTLYVLDEPTIGLHPRDSHKLIRMLHKIKESDNTVVIVEHDREVITNADYLVELGPKAGAEGGQVIFNGSMEEFLKCQESVTARYLRGEKTIPLPHKRRRISGRYLYLLEAEEHNLKKVNLKIPLRTLTCVTGVSGSGKSTLVHDTLYNALARIFHKSTQRSGRFRVIIGFENIKDVILLDQKPIGKSPRSNPITFLKAFDPIRVLFAQTPLARIRGYSSSYFSFNMSGGRCPNCRGEGYLKVEMHFMADIYIRCQQCQGTRYRPDILEVKFKGKNIHEVLEMTIDEALCFFRDVGQVERKLSLLSEIGLGYLKIGQPATTLSGGEAQRLKIAAQLTLREPKGNLYIMDEPTTGLHFEDIKRLLQVLNKLVDSGNTVLVVEHNMEVVKTADYVIDLGPEGGEEGGYIVAEGRPEEIAKVENSYTGRFLKTILNKNEDATFF